MDMDVRAHVSVWYLCEFVDLWVCVYMCKLVYACGSVWKRVGMWMCMHARSTWRRKKTYANVALIVCNDAVSKLDSTKRAQKRISSIYVQNRPFSREIFWVTKKHQKNTKSGPKITKLLATQ